MDKRPVVPPETLNSPTIPSDITVEWIIEPLDNERLSNLCGQLDEHLRQIERRLAVQVNNRAGRFRVSGAEAAAGQAIEVLKNLYSSAGTEVLTPERVHLAIQESTSTTAENIEPESDDDVLIRTKRGVIRGRSLHQRQYLQAIQKFDINFGIGPAGTGKTYLAVACAVQALERDEVRRVVLVRPAVEAGERLGFLPGDLVAKVDPYLRPLYDALYEMLGFERVAKLIERNVIEVAPLAFMRGRTLNEAFIILDEAQNTSIEQMKMFLTRIGFGSTAVVTGDITQIDLPRHQVSGLKHCTKVLADVAGISFTRFDNKDVVRHPLVQRIVKAYEVHEASQDDGSKQ